MNGAQRVAVVTGGGAGIGSALVARLAREAGHLDKRPPDFPSLPVRSSDVPV